MGISALVMDRSAHSRRWKCGQVGSRRRRLLADRL